MPRDLEDTIWADTLKRKHECGPAPARLVGVPLGREGRTVRVRMPDIRAKPERLEIKATVASDDLLILFARHTLEDGDDPYECGIVMVGRRTGPESYDVHVWHELYPWALKHLGLDGPAPSEV